MLDWTTTLIECDARAVPSGRIFKTDEEGEIEFESPTWNDYKSPSHDANIRYMTASPTAGMMEFARALGRECSPVCLRVSGNPAKFLQGHNVIGPSACYHAPLVMRTLDAIDKLPPIDIPTHLPAFDRSRQDINVMIDLHNAESDSYCHQGCGVVHRWLDTWSACGKSRTGTAVKNGTTVIYNKGSRRWVLMAYCKFCELIKHPHKDERVQDVLLDYAYGKLRIELKLRGQELKQYGTLDESIVWNYYNRVWRDVLPSKLTEADMSKNLSRSVLATFYQWQEGHVSPQSFGMSARTYYRHRKLIKEASGFDIAVPYKEIAKQLHNGKSVDLSQFDVEFLKAHQVPERPEHAIGQYTLKFPLTV